MTRASLMLAALSLWIGAAAAHAALPVGGLSQLPGSAGCVTFDGSSEDGALTCGIGHAMVEAESAIPSPDGRNLYVGSYAANSPGPAGGLTVFSRDPSTGQVTQLAGKPGCFTSDGASAAGPNTCTEARGMQDDLGDGRDVAFTSDGLWVYVAAQKDNLTWDGSILIFRRDPTTGALTQLPGSDGCITADGTSQDGAGTCQTDATLDHVNGLTMSSDDRFVYATDYGSTHRLHVFSRGSDGGLTEIQCLSDQTAPAGCGTARVVGSSASVVLSPDGQHAYTTDYSYGISIFDRNPSTGLLTQKPGSLGCVTDDGNDDHGDPTCATGRELSGSYSLSISPDGHTLYAPSSADGGLSTWHVNADGSLSQLPGSDGCISPNGKDDKGASTCAVGRNVSQLYGSAISPDGGTLYAANIQNDNTGHLGGLAAFSLDPASGRATQLPGATGCVSPDGSADGVPGECTNGRAVGHGYSVAVSPDSRFVYEATDDSTNAGVAIFARASAPVCSAISAAVPHAKPAAITLTCSDADGDPITRTIIAAPNHGALGPVSGDTVTYTPAAGYSGSDSFAFTGSDGVNTSAPATVSLTVAKGSEFAGSALVSRTLVVDAKGNLKVKVRCPAAAPSGKCADVLSLFTPSGSLPKSAKAKRARQLAKARFSVTAGKTVTMRIHLNTAGRKLAKAHRRFKARLVLRSTSGANASARRVYRVTVKHAKAKRKG